MCNKTINFLLLSATYLAELGLGKSYNSIFKALSLFNNKNIYIDIYKLKTEHLHKWV